MFLWSDGGNRQHHFTSNINKGLLANTAFTGFDMARYSISRALSGYDQLQGTITPVRFASAREIGTAQLRFLKDLSQRADQSESCLFYDVECSLEKHLCCTLDEMQPHPSADVEARRLAFQEMHNKLMMAANPHPKDGQAICEVHGCL